MAAVVNYSPPWWVNLLHRLPHFNVEFQIVSSDFRPEDSEYQKVRGQRRATRSLQPSASSLWPRVAIVMVLRLMVSPLATCSSSSLATWRRWRLSATELKPPLVY